jgi:hypothetical protein
LFLPAVDHLGIRLPIAEIVGSIQQRCDLRFTLVDAAQALCQLPLEDLMTCADFIVAGSHKWMGAYMPTGIGLFGRARSRESIVRASERIGDPLLNFIQQLDATVLPYASETANVTPLFACAGAAADRLEVPATSLQRVSQFSLSYPSGNWRPLRPQLAMQSRIVLLRATVCAHRLPDADALRRAWLREGKVVTAYDDGIVRLSFPVQHVTQSDSEAGDNTFRTASPHIDLNPGNHYIYRRGAKWCIIHHQQWLNNGQDRETKRP